MGSVKDLKVYEDSSELCPGLGEFIFSDRYSIFDWGEMPDLIPNKGKALCMMAAWNFEQLFHLGIKTHYLGLGDIRNPFTTCNQRISDRMAILLAGVIKPGFVDGEYDYSYFIRNRGEINNYVIPLEVIYRNGVPKGSSLLKKFKKAKGKELKSLLKKYNIKEKPEPGTMFDKTYYDFTTKFEEEDRALTEDEAFEISGLTEEAFEEMLKIRNKSTRYISSNFAGKGIIDYDGKQEYIYSNGIMLGDVIGTPDENRLFYNGMQVSKEILRQYHKVHQKEWYEAILKTKKIAKEIGIKDWKFLVKIRPKKLDPKLVNLIGEMYVATADKVVGLFHSRPLAEVMEDLKPYYVEE